MRVMVAGDWHGNTKHAVNLINKAGDLKIQHVLQVGDFGLWTHSLEGHVYLDEIQDAARCNNLSVYVVGGNHENWDHWNWITNTMPGSKGFSAVRSRVLLAPKANGWTWAGKKFGSAGGAVSIDRDFRLARERGGMIMTAMGLRDFGRGTGPRTQWWPDEQFSEHDLIKYKMNVGKVDYLFTHDCSDYTPFHDRLKPDLDSKAHRQRIDKVIANSQASMHFHGHMHTRYDWENARSHGFFEPGEGARATRTIGLEADPAAMDRRSGAPGDSWGVLDVETGEWLWPDDVSASIERRRAAKEDAVAKAVSHSGLSPTEL
jgi:Icc-related predicted phosphoesterase